MIEVVAGVIYKDNKFLIAKRNLKKSQGGLWEFHGGKVENNETYEILQFNNEDYNIGYGELVNISNIKLK